MSARLLILQASCHYSKLLTENPNISILWLKGRYWRPNFEKTLSTASHPIKRIKPLRPPRTQIRLIFFKAISPRAVTGACALSYCRTIQHPIKCGQCGPLRRSPICLHLLQCGISPCVHLTCWSSRPCAFRHQP